MTPAVAPSVRGQAVPVVAGVVRRGVEEAAVALGALGVPAPSLGGKLLRPLVAYALVPPALRGAVDERFWAGALAVEMVHEASLLHDDILDDATERRGVPTEVARRGMASALVLGDHYLTGAYRAASLAGSPDFLATFIEAVERTVAGEVAQARSAGRALSDEEYERIVTGKSGELFGAAASLAGALFAPEGLDDRVAFGRALGALYQRVDDLLDCCPAADTGKAPLQDYRQGKWTWVLELAGVNGFDLAPEALLAALFASSRGEPSAARRAVSAVRLRGNELIRRARTLSPGDTLVAGVVEGWVAAAEAAVHAQEGALGLGLLTFMRPSAPTAEAEVRSLAAALGEPRDWPDYFGTHAKTFRFASRLFPAEQAALVSGLYAYCRFTDDLVDEPADGAPPSRLAERLEAWSHLTRVAFEGSRTGISLLDTVLGEAGPRGVSWRYPDALLAGVAMDLTGARFEDWPELEEYTFGVAGAVGGWMTQLFGIHEEDLLLRAHALGHAMQLTNIARDVGEDLARGRLYLPAQLLVAHSLTEAELVQLAAGPGPVSPAYREMMETLLRRADAYYDQAWPGIRALPGWYRRPVAVAAEAYRGIHDVVRAQGYDTLRRRASTGMGSKLVLAASGLVRARSVRG